MFKKVISGVLSCLLIQMTAQVESLSARTQADKQALFAEKVKTSVAQLGVGEGARVTVKLRDKTKLEGYVSKVRQDSFDITDLKTGTPTTVAYPDVAKAKGHNLSTGAKIAIGAGIGAGIVLLILLLYIRANG
jgi:hypothetical protein